MLTGFILLASTLSTFDGVVQDSIQHANRSAARTLQALSGKDQPGALRNVMAEDDRGESVRKPASPRKREEARKAGQVARSPDLTFCRNGALRRAGGPDGARRHEVDRAASYLHAELARPHRCSRRSRGHSAGTVHIAGAARSSHAGDHSAGRRDQYAGASASRRLGSISRRNFSNWIWSVSIRSAVCNKCFRSGQS